MLALKKQFVTSNNDKKENGRIFTALMLTGFSCVCQIEALIGLFQLISSHYFNHYSYSVTGSFKNPGPYGGFLSICISILASYCILNRSSYKCDKISRLFGGVSLIVSITALAILPFTQSRSAMLALGCSIVLLAFGNERIKVKITPFLKQYGLWLTLGLTIIVFSAYLFKKPSADGRFFMDKICIKTMCENGWKGAGLGHFGGAYGEMQARFFKKQIDEKGKNDLDWRAINGHERMMADCPDNAFNEFLFIGVEAGPLVMLLFIGIIVTAIVVSFTRGTIWCYGLTSFAVFAMFSYPLHVKQFQVMLPVLLVTAISDGALRTTRTKIPKIAILSITLAILSIIAIRKLPVARHYKQIETAWKKIECWHKMEYYEYVVEDCETHFSYMKHNYRFLFAYGQSLNKTGKYEKSDSILKMGTKISSDPMFWNVMGNNSLALGKYREAEERYKHAFYMVPNRLYPLYLLARLYHTEGDTIRFLDMADRVETFIPKVESANTEQLRAEIREQKTEYQLESD